MHFSTCLKLSHEQIENYDDYKDYYENANDLVHGLVHSDTLLPLADDMTLDPNSRQDIIRSSINMLNLYFKLDKQKKVTNYSMSVLGHNV